MFSEKVTRQYSLRYLQFNAMPCQEIKKLKKLFFLNETWIAVNTEKMAVCACADVSYSPLYIICDVKKAIASLLL